LPDKKFVPVQAAGVGVATAGVSHGATGDSAVVAIHANADFHVKATPCKCVSTPSQDKSQQIVEQSIKTGDAEKPLPY